VRDDGGDTDKSSLFAPRSRLKNTFLDDDTGSPSDERPSGLS
jgi:hypothetical protein